MPHRQKVKNIDNTNFMTLAGDIDKDGLADLVIGAAAQDGPGAAYVIYGKEGGYTDFDISALTPTMGAKISSTPAWNVNTRGDYNKDGIADLVIASSGQDSTFGAVFVIYGSQTRLTSFDSVSTPLTSDKGFKISGYSFAYIGAAFASVGDFDGDGYGDFTFSAPGALSEAGVGYVIYGKSAHFSDFSVTTSGAAGRFTVTGSSSISYKLSLVASDGGDFDGDGFSDILWASPITNTDEGHVMLIYGASGGPADFALSSISGSQGLSLSGGSGNYLGSSLSSLKDVNGDGVTEILVGARGLSSTGAVYLIYGRDDYSATLNLLTLPAAEGFKILGATAGSLFGASTRDIGDINGDGASDIIIGAPGTGTTGKVYVVYGVNAWACNTCDTFKKCQTCEAGYSYKYNGVCYKSCPKEAPFNLNFECFTTDPTPPPDTARGDITLSGSLPSCKGFIISNSGTNTRFAYAVDGGGDFNGDKIPDFVISSYEAPSPSTVYVIYGKADGSYSPIDVNSISPAEGFKITGLEIKDDENSNFISLAGDLDKDGMADLVIAASQADSGAGAVYVVYGGSGYIDFDVSSPPSTAIKISNAAAYTVNARTDINGDQISDLIIGSKTADSNNGAVYVIYGSKTRFSSFDIISTPLTPAVGFKISGFSNGYLGMSVASIGDFNGDQIADLTFSTPGAMTNQGNGYVLYGKSGTSVSDFAVSSISNPNGLTVNGASSISQLFLTASDAGDFNNDGFSDVLWGSYSTNTNQGVALLIYGGGSTDFGVSAMTPSQGLKITGAAMLDFFGFSLSSLGDINGDGINEILVGAPGYSYYKGALYLLYGRTDKPSTIDLDTFTTDDGFKILSSTPNSALGTSVRDIGDINGDGVSDLLVGAPGSGTPGKAYILFGPNAWGCDTCDTSKTCKACKSGYDYIVNGLCYKTCPVNAPYKLNGKCYTTDPTPSSVIQPTLKQTVTKSALTTYATNKVLNLWSPADALPFLYGQLKTSITYMQYLNVSHSQKLEELYQMYADSSSNIIPWVSMPSSLKGSFPNYNLPYMFQKYELPSSFLVNFGDDFTCLVVVLVTFTVVQTALTVIKKWMRNIPTVKFLLHKASIFLQNFFVGSFAESLGPIVFYTTLEWKNSAKGGKAYSVLSPLTCYLCILLGISIMILNIWIVRKFQVVKKKILPEPQHEEKNQEYEVLEKKYEGFAVLYEEFDNESVGQQLAFFLFNLRAIIESLIIGVLFDSPLAQTILLMLLNLFFLAYMLIKKPFDSKIGLIQQLSLVLLIFICDCSLIQLAHLDRVDNNSESSRNNASEVIFVLLIIFQFIPLLFFAINMTLSAWEAYKFLKNELSAKKKHTKFDKNKPDQSSISPLDQSSQFKTNNDDAAVTSERLLTDRVKNKGEFTLIQSRIHPRKKRMITPYSEAVWDSNNANNDQTIVLGNAESVIEGEPSKEKMRNEMMRFDTRPTLNVNLENSESPLSKIVQENLAGKKPPNEIPKEKIWATLERNLDDSPSPPSKIEQKQEAASPKESLAERFFNLEPRPKRIQNEIKRLKTNSNSESFGVNLEAPESPFSVLEQEEMKPPQAAPEKKNLIQLIVELQTKARKNQLGE